MEALARLLHKHKNQNSTSASQTEPLLSVSSPSALHTHPSDANHYVGRAPPPATGRRAVGASKMVFWFGCCGGKRPSRSKRERKHRRSRRERKHHLSAGSRGAAGAHPEVYAPPLSVTSVASGVCCALVSTLHVLPLMHLLMTSRYAPQTLNTMMPGMPGQWVTQVRPSWGQDSRRVIPLCTAMPSIAQVHARTACSSRGAGTGGSWGRHCTPLTLTQLQHAPCLPADHSPLSSAQISPRASSWTEHVSVLCMPASFAFLLAPQQPVHTHGRQQCRRAL